MILERIEEECPGAIVEKHDFRGDLTLVVEAGRLLELVDLCYRDGFQQLMDITAVDWQTRDPRFDVVYHFLNLTSQDRLRVKVRIAEESNVPSLAARFKSANWNEREVFDMFGITFDGHPNLERLLMWKDFPGHPLRKDYPMDGGDVFCNDTGASFAGKAESLA